MFNNFEDSESMNKKLTDECFRLVKKLRETEIELKVFKDLVRTDTPKNATFLSAYMGANRRLLEQLTSVQKELKEARSTDDQRGPLPYPNPENLTSELAQAKIQVDELTEKLERAVMDSEGKSKKIESMTGDMEKHNRMVEEAFRIARAQSAENERLREFLRLQETAARDREEILTALRNAELTLREHETTNLRLTQELAQHKSKLEQAVNNVKQAELQRLMDQNTLKRKEKELMTMKLKVAELGSAPGAQKNSAELAAQLKEKDALITAMSSEMKIMSKLLKEGEDKVLKQSGQMQTLFERVANMRSVKDSDEDKKLQQLMTDKEKELAELKADNIQLFDIISTLEGKLKQVGQMDSIMTAKVLSLENEVARLKSQPQLASQPSRQAPEMSLMMMETMMKMQQQIDVLKARNQ